MPDGPGLELQRAVSQAVKLVNAHSGQTSVHLCFRSMDFPEIDFVANSASIQGDKFHFTAGFETFDGSVTELTDIRAQLINHDA
ncbi:MAG: hypothetical protein ABIG44_14240 [Planctomycetota bacterium]